MKADAPAIGRWRPQAGRMRRLGGLGLPIIGGLLSQNLHNLVDVAMVGRLGTTQVAAVGLGSFASFALFAAVMGLSSAVQALASRRMGQGRPDGLVDALHGALAVAVGLGLVGSALGLLLLPWVLDAFTADAALKSAGGDYLGVRLCAMLAVGLNYAFRGFWLGLSRPGVDFGITIASHVLNIALSAVLIFGLGPVPALGVAGAAWGTVIATYAASGVHAALCRWHTSDLGALRRWPRSRALGPLLRHAVPSAAQHGLFALGYLVLLAILARVGTEAAAAGSLLVQVSLFTILPALGLGQAAATLVGQALGRGDARDARHWGWDALLLGTLILAALGLPLLLVPDAVLWVFLPDEPSTRALAAPALRLVGAVASLDAAGLVLQYALLGAGDVRRVAGVVVGLQWLVLLPLAWVVGPWLGLGLLGVWSVLAAQRALQSVVFAVIWREGRWARVSV